MSRPPLPPGPYLVVGLARSGIAAALALADELPDARIVACDIGRPAEAVDVAGRLDSSGVEVHFETDGLELLEGEAVPRTLVKSPGVPKEASVVSASRSADIYVIGELELAWRMLDNQFCAVTGTNGKTTTCEMIGAMFRRAGEPVEVVGNVGVAASSLVGRIGPDATIVCEASSFQLEDCDKFAPEAAVFLNISEDHMDRHGSGDEYLQAKLNVFAGQDSGDAAILNAGQPELREASIPGYGSEVWFGLQQPCRERGDCSAYVDEGAVWWKQERLFSQGDLQLRGTHNLENALAAVSAGMCLGLDGKSVAAAIKEFPGVPHRLEEIAEVDAVLYVNDSKATNIDSTVVALEAFGEGVHLILGGRLKGGSFEGLRESVSRACRGCYLIGEAAGKIENDLADCDVTINMCGDLNSAVAEAGRSAGPGEVVLLAPACASFDQYEDFEQRGESFRELVLDLKGPD